MAERAPPQHKTAHQDTAFSANRSNSAALDKPNASPATAFDLSRVPVRPRPLIQAKLKIGEPDDPSEREADRVAGQIVGLSDDVARSRPASSCEVRMPFGIQAESARPNHKIEREPPAIVNEVLNSPGQPLDGATRAFMEPRFGRDFSHVRVHANAAAALSANAIGARAYTVGHRIVFGQVAPSDRRILAHELTHVIQQERSGGGVIQRTEIKDAANEMVGKIFILNSDLPFQKLTKGTRLEITAWSYDANTAKARVSGADKSATFDIDKKFLTPSGSTAVGLQQYHSGVGRIEGEIASLEKTISERSKAVSEWEKQKRNYRANPEKWEEQEKNKKRDLADSKYKLTGEWNSTEKLPDRLMATDEAGVKTPVVPKRKQLNDALIEETMLNAFDGLIVKWLNYYHQTMGIPRKWPRVDPNLVKSIIYQESHMGTFGKILEKGPYTAGSIKTRFNIGQAIDSSGPQLIIMIKEMSPKIASKYNLPAVEARRQKANARWDALMAKGKGKYHKEKTGEVLKIKLSALTPAEKAEFTALGDRSGNGKAWNRYYQTDPDLVSAFAEFSSETKPRRSEEYDFWIRTAVRWLYEKRKGKKVRTWEAAVEGFNGSGPDATRYKEDVIDRKNAAGGDNFVPKQHYP